MIEKLKGGYFSLYLLLIGSEHFRWLHCTNLQYAIKVLSMQLVQLENSIFLQGSFRVEHLNKLKTLLSQEKTIPYVWDCSELEIEDAQAMAALIAFIKNLLQEGVSITLVSPPQLLMHNLYRIGCFPHSFLTALEIRQEEAYG